MPTVAVKSPHTDQSLCYRYTYGSVVPQASLRWGRTRQCPNLHQCCRKKSLHCCDTAISGTSTDPFAGLEGGVCCCAHADFAVDIIKVQKSAKQMNRLLYVAVSQELFWQHASEFHVHRDQVCTHARTHAPTTRERSARLSDTSNIHSLEGNCALCTFETFPLPPCHREAPARRLYISLVFFVC